MNKWRVAYSGRRSIGKHGVWRAFTTARQKLKQNFRITCFMISRLILPACIFKLYFERLLTSDMQCYNPESLLYARIKDRTPLVQVPYYPIFFSPALIPVMQSRNSVALHY